MKRTWLALALAGVLALLATASLAMDEASGSRHGFDPDWKQAWREQRLARATNAFRVEPLGDGYVLRVESVGSASALWRDVELEAEDVSTVSWRWRVERSLSHIEDERSRGGDDYSARVAVIFDAEPFSRRARALMYVWAGSEPAGSVYANPYTGNVATIVVRSGDDACGFWLDEQRDLANDYERFFGEPPERITGVAVLVDTDNTDSEAIAWFDTIELRPPVTTAE